jgi:hypothetical protein
LKVAHIPFFFTVHNSGGGFTLWTVSEARRQPSREDLYIIVDLTPFICKIIEPVSSKVMVERNR